MTEIDPALVEADVRRLLGDAYASPDARTRYDAAMAAEKRHAAHAAAVARRIADVRALAVSDLYEQGGRGDKKAFGAQLGLTRQRAGQLLDRARDLATKEGASAEA